MRKVTDLSHSPVLGGPAPRTAFRTASKLSGFALRYIDAVRSPPPHRYLDVGCGNGFITSFIAPKFEYVTGLDVEPERLAEFRKAVGEDPKYSILDRPAEATGLPDASFCFITSFEVLEHVADPYAAAAEIVRVCAPGGVIIISVPQVGFPFENHGMQVGSRVFERKIPLLPYIRPLHRRWSLARVFSSGEVDDLFLPHGVQRLGTGYAAPQFERAAAQPGSWESHLTFLRGVLDRAESVPVVQSFVGVSMLKAFRRSL